MDYSLFGLPLCVGCWLVSRAEHVLLHEQYKY